MNDTDPALMTAEDLLALYASRSLSPVEALQAVTERVARHNPRINAFAVMNPGALADAHASAARWRVGRPMGALDGVPVTVKDLVDMAGLPTRRGSRLTSPEPAVDDAPSVVGLRQAGAVIIGKTTTTEFGWKSPGDCPALPAIRGTCITRLAGRHPVPGRRRRPVSVRCISALMPAGRCVSRRHGPASWG